MGQKKRSPAPRHVAASNDSLPPATSELLETTGSPVPADAELCPNGAGNACNMDGGFLINGELVANGGRLEVTKGGGGLEISKICQGDLPSVKSDCEKALVALRRGNSTKALKLIRDACNRYESNALVQRVRGHICMRLASMIEDLTTKQRHLKEAIEGAQKAVLLSPRSVEYAQFNAQLLFEAAADGKGYDEVVQECQRALHIQDPIDPAKESLHEEGQHKLPTAEARIGQVQQELRNLLQKANFASLSNWMKTLGNGGSGEEKLRFIHMRKLVDDPMEQRVSQPKRPHEVKKSVKTPEEKRKDIEVRVAAARLLQQKRDCSPPHSDDGAVKPTKGGAPLERRKSGGSNSRKPSQAQSIEERVERLKPFWNAIDSKERDRMLKVPLDSLKHQFSSSKMSLTSELLTEALEFAQEKETWRFWMCCSCGERFIDCQEHAEHVMHKHIDNLSPKLRRLLPNEIDQDMADQIMAEDCRPFDGHAAMKLLIESCHAGIDEEAAQNHPCPASSTNGFDCFGDAIASLRESCLDNLGDSIDRKFADAAGDSVAAEPSLSLDKREEQGQNTDKAYMCDGKCQRPKTIQRIGRDMKRDEFPYADDEERTKLLQKIYNLFGILIRNKCLASDHMEKIVQYALDELQSFLPDSSVHYEFNHSPIYVRFLPAPQLLRIFGYLRELVNACGSDQLDSGLPTGPQNEDDDVILDRLFFNGDFTALTLDERRLKETSGKSMEISLSTGSDNSVKQLTTSNEVDAQPLSLTVMKDGKTISHTDLQLSWIYGTADYEYQPVGWKQFREDRAQQGRDILRVLEKEFLSLQSFCERKREHLHYEVAVNMAEALCIEELKKRELKVDGSFTGHEAVLRKRHQELLEGRATGPSSQRKLELEVIKSILREARTVDLPQFSYDSAIAMTSARLSDSDEEDEDAWRVQEFVPQLDACIEVAIQRQKERSTSEINKLDARILRSMDSVQRLKHKLGNASILDYRSVVLPLVKSFLKGRLEDAAEKDALQKSDAAREAFLAELSHDGRTSTERLSDSARHLKEKSKDKRKNKEQRRSKDGKRASGAALETQQKSNGYRLAVDIVGDEDGLEWEVEESRQVMEAELRRQAEVEVEERKLAETLELQRRVEEEAKEKHLAELKKKQSEIESKGVSQIPGDILSSENDSAFSQINNGLCSDDILPNSLAKEDAVVHLLKETHISDSPLMHNAVHYGFVKSTSHRDNEVAETLASSSLPCTADLPTEQQSTVFSEKGVTDYVYHESQLTADLRRPTNDLRPSRDSENNDSSSSRPKKSGKSRRRKLARASQEDSNHRNTSEEQCTAGGQFLEQTKTQFMDNESVVWNGSVDRARLLEAGHVQTSSSSCTLKKKHSSEKDGVFLESLRRTAHTPNKTLQQLTDEQDAEERFQADIEQAMRQSLDFPFEISQIEPMRNDYLTVSENKRNMLEVGKGLQNESGQYNCFLNVVIQSLWHLGRFREEILAISSIHHVHVGDPCVVCALRDIFVGLNSPRSDMNKEAVAPTTLRIALSNLFSQKDFFQEAQMNDASEVLAVIFDCLHKAFAVNSVLSDGDSDTSSGIGFWECQQNTPCVAHNLFALDIAMQMNCKCGLESRHLKYTSFFHNINANSLRNAKILDQESSLDELLSRDMNQLLVCDVEMGGCGELNYIHYLLRAAPHVFITVLGWQNNRESLEDISATMDAIAVDMDVGIVYGGLDKGFKHQLVSVICYYGQHYHCFAFNHEVGRWIMFDDTTVKVIGTYEDVLDTCRRGHLQPQVLFYEAFSG